jgi:hypothetical protein
MSASKKAFPDRFFEGPAISFGRQPNLKRLFEYLIDPDRTFTFVVGAGVSLDANLPTWTRLIENITELIPAERWRRAAKEDHSELVRKSESSLRLAQEDSNNTANGIIRDALYRRSDGSMNNDPKYGRLADVIARLATWLKDRVYIATTNFDTLLEDALETYTLTDNDEIMAVPFVAPKKGDGHYDSYEKSGIPANWLPGSTVLHLHGILEPGLDPLGNIVLTETDFHRYGPAVRDLIKRRLQSSHVVFFGVSLTDPNLVSPLWQVHTEAPHACDVKEPFLLSVAAPDPQARDVNASRAYAIKKAQYLSEELGLHTIFLKSYGQQIQSIAEASLAIWHGDRYMIDDNPATSSRYGHRLKRCLDFCYTNIGCSAGQDIPADEYSRLLSDRLHTLLNSDRNGSINRIFHSVRERLGYSNDTELSDDFESGLQYFDKENLGLFLWLRATKAKNQPSAHYHLKCVGTSVYQHREPWSLDRVAEIKGDSRFTCARAAFYGSPKVENFTKADSWLLWHSVRAVPFSYYERDAPTEDRSNGDPDKAMTAIDVGVITLNSTHNYAPIGESRWSRDNPRSLFSVMNDDEKSAVNDELARIALEAVSSPVMR